MNDELKQIEALIEGFSFKDFLGKDFDFTPTSLRLLVQKLETKIESMRAAYYSSEENQKYRKIINDKANRERKARQGKKEAASKWCEQNLKPGMWVKMRTRSSLKNRLVTGIINKGCSHQGGDPLTGKVHYLSTWSGFEAITHVFNTESRIMEKIDVLIGRSAKSS